MNRMPAALGSPHLLAVPPPAVLMIQSTALRSDLWNTKEDEADREDGYNEGADSDRRKSL